MEINIPEADMDGNSPIAIELIGKSGWTAEELGLALDGDGDKQETFAKGDFEEALKKVTRRIK